MVYWIETSRPSALSYTLEYFQGHYSSGFRGIGRMSTDSLGTVVDCNF